MIFLPVLGSSIYTYMIKCFSRDLERTNTPLPFLFKIPESRSKGSCLYILSEGVKRLDPQMVELVVNIVSFPLFCHSMTDFIVLTSVLVLRVLEVAKISVPSSWGLHGETGRNSEFRLGWHWGRVWDPRRGTREGSRDPQCI